MEIQTGIPTVDGLYLVFVPSDLPEYSRPLVLLWRAAQWNYPNSAIRYDRRVWGWLGPLPCGKLAEMFPVDPAEYDL
jgi:hypothetical protein